MTIQLNITSGEPATASVSGVDIAKLNDEIAAKFGVITHTGGKHQELWNGAKQLTGRYPDSMWLVKRAQNPDPVQMITQGIHAKIISHKARVSAVGRKFFDNSKSSTENTYESTLSDTITLTSSKSSNWDIRAGSSTTAFVEVGGEAAGVKAGISTTFFVEGGYGESNSQEYSRQRSVEDKAIATVPGGEKRAAFIQLSIGEVEVEITKSAYLTGDVAICYLKKLKGYSSNWYITSIEKLLEAAGIPNEIQFKEILKIGFASEGIVRIEDA